MTNLKAVKFSVAAIAAALASACATPPYVPTVYDASMSPVQTIAISDQSVPDKMGANELATATGSGQAGGGLIGFLVVSAIEGAETSSRKGKLAALMEPLNFDPETEFEEMLKLRLADAGYQGLKVIEVERTQKSSLKSSPDSSADAILNIELVKFGMQKAKTGDDWRPAAGVKVELVDTKTNAILMENRISYNSGVLGIPETQGFIIMAPDLASSGYRKIKDMDPEVVRDETLIMLEDIADMIITLL